MKQLLYRLYRATLRVVPSCITQTQAIAFNMFLAFFPMILLAVGTVLGSRRFQLAFRGMILRLRPLLPPGSLTLLNSLPSQDEFHAWRWILLGLGGTLIAGTQMMKLLMEGFRMVHRDEQRENFLSIHARALLLLIATLVPSVLTVNLVVFGREVRRWLLHVSAMPEATRLVSSLAYVCISLLIAMFGLGIIYFVGRPDSQSLASVAPGAAVATALWWVVSIGLGFYLRYVPYSIVYGAFAVAIGLMIWMQLTATIVLIGAAYNAELQQSPN